MPNIWMPRWHAGFRAVCPTQKAGPLYGPPRLEGVCTCMAYAALVLRHGRALPQSVLFNVPYVVVNRALEPSEGACSDMNSQNKKKTILKDRVQSSIKQDHSPRVRI